MEEYQTLAWSLRTQKRNLSKAQNTIVVFLFVEAILDTIHRCHFTVFPRRPRPILQLENNGWLKFKGKSAKHFRYQVQRECAQDILEKKTSSQQHQTVHISKEEPFHPFLSGQYNSLKPGEALFVMYKLSR
ncbi:hypothetical protein QZH41_012204 [Actinostola sp. cb2023]|nr:hypothetical protein QZH41_012204 [Actinostola sp. cb2023]